MAWLFIGVIVLVVIIALAVIVPIYNVWSSEQNGKAELAHAEYGKQVAVQTSLAKSQAAVYEAQAEVTRAEGVAKANLIIGESLKGNSVYLDYLWVNALNERVGDTQVIYVPTDGQMPLMEAGRAVPTTTTASK